MAEQRHQRGDVDARRREPVAERRVGHHAGRPRHGLDAVERDQGELRIGVAEPLVAEQRIGDAPAVVDLADQVLGRHHHVVEEHLAELVVARDGADRPDADARALEVEQQEADAGMARLRLRVGAHQREHPLRMMPPGGPDLLPVHHEVVALQRRAGRETREIGAGARLRIALRPDHRAVEDRRQVPGLLRRGAELDQDRADVMQPLRRQVRRADPRQLLGHDDLLVERRAHAAVLLRPVRRDPALARQRVVPRHQLVGRRAVGAPAQRHRQVGLEPGPHLGAKRGLLR